MNVEPVNNVNSVPKSNHLRYRTMNVCRHKNPETGQSYFVIIENRRKAVSPFLYRGICTNCLKEYALTKEQYDEYLRTGELPYGAIRK